MECNKEEAIRAKEIALKKMENQDFAGARKVAIKSQLLYPGLENLNQIICVCDVHCSAENKKLGNVRDWYDILNVEQPADETLIKKQYRKLALLLHPDKNRFSGAESAFLLIGEAQGVLLDKDKRIEYDAMYRRLFQNAALKNAKPPSGKNNMTKTGTSDVLKKPQQQADPVDPSRIETFWTVCPFCSNRDRYSSTLNENLKCQSCKKEFATYDTCDKSIPPGSKVNQTDTSAQKGVFNQASCAQGVSNKSGTCNGKFQANTGQEKSRGGSSTRGGKSKTTDELHTGGKSRASPGGSNHAEVKDGKKGKKKQAAVEEACVTDGKIKKKKKKKKQASVGKNGDTVTKEMKNQVPSERTGDSVAKRAKREVKDSLEKSGRRSSQSKVCTGPEDKIAEKGGGASASSQSKKRGFDTEVEETLNSSKVHKREKRECAEIAGAKRRKKEVKDSLLRSQSKVCTEPSCESKKRVSETEVGGGEQALNSLKCRKGNAEVESTNFRKPPDSADENGRSNPGMLNTPAQGLLSGLLLQLVMKLHQGYNNFMSKSRE